MYSIHDPHGFCHTSRNGKVSFNRGSGTCVSPRPAGAATFLERAPQKTLPINVRCHRRFTITFIHHPGRTPTTFRDLQRFPSPPGLRPRGTTSPSFDGSPDGCPVNRQPVTFTLVGDCINLTPHHKRRRDLLRPGDADPDGAPLPVSLDSRRGSSVVPPEPALKVPGRPLDPDRRRRYRHGDRLFVSATAPGGKAVPDHETPLRNAAKRRPPVGLSRETMGSRRGPFTSPTATSPQNLPNTYGGTTFAYRRATVLTTRIPWVSQAPATGT